MALGKSVGIFRDFSPEKQSRMKEELLLNADMNEVYNYISMQLKTVKTLIYEISHAILHLSN